VTYVILCQLVEGSACGELVAEPVAATAAPGDAAAGVDADVPATPVRGPAHPETTTSATRPPIDLHLNLEIPPHDALTPNLESPTKKSAWQRRSEDAKDRRPRKVSAEEPALPDFAISSD